MHTNIGRYYLYQAIWRRFDLSGKALYKNQIIIILNYYHCLAKVPGCQQYYRNIVWSLFQNGR